ncbi:Sulfotransferase [Olavius algarvensis associated proteobacterium Delta 3]|nr:Sulfotransferase [Olavius algarvensis associated proteobacterium Delta 3]
MTRMPDFIIIGAMKCATTTLHEQLAQQPGIFMTEPKEPYFFSNDDVWAKGQEWYAGLYDSAALGDICGESSTHYTKLPTYPQTILRMLTHVPEAKLIYVIRHPIDRLISHYIHDWSERIIDEPIDEAIANRPELISYSKYAMQIRPFLENYGDDNVLLVFFEHLLLEPQQELERIARFIGYSDRPVWHRDSAANVSSKRMQRSLFRDAIVWNPFSTWLRRRLVPQATRDWVKGFWQMKKRPQLGERMRNELENIFDEDLSRLSLWVDADLSCRTFAQVAKATMPNWEISSLES